MEHKKRSFIKWSTGVGLAGLAALAMGQGYFARGPIITDGTIRLEMSINQLMSHARMLETELIQQKKEVEQLKKDVKEEKEKAVKVEKRLRAMELRGK